MANEPPTVFHSFDKVLNTFEISEEELKRLVVSGELRAFRSKGQMKFREKDLDDLVNGGLLKKRERPIGITEAEIHKCLNGMRTAPVTCCDGDAYISAAETVRRLKGLLRDKGLLLETPKEEKPEESSPT